MPYKDKTKQREYQRRWKDRRRAKFFHNKACCRCGATDSLELDHIDPETKVTHRIWTWTWAKIHEEAAKCQILCRSCHAHKSWNEEGRKRAQHGTHSKYTKGCRCDACKEGHRKENAAYRARQRNGV